MVRGNSRSHWPGSKLWVLLLLGGLVFWPAVASGYCRTTTCDPRAMAAKDACVLDDDLCEINGEPLFWVSSCVSLAVHESGSPRRGISFDKARELALQAMGRWLEVDCRGERPSLELLDLSPALCGEGEYNPDNANANVLLFRDDIWPHEGPGATLALTVLTFNTVTGEIYDADIEVNSFHGELTLNGEPSGYDLLSILTHEAGHFLGFAHSWVPGSTMREGGLLGDTSMRTLAADDADGMCAVYPPNRTTRSSDCHPRHGFSPECAPNESRGCGCRHAPDPGAPWPLFAAGALGFVRRRLRAPRGGAEATRRPQAPATSRA